MSSDAVSLAPPSRDAAWALVQENVREEGLRRHMLAVECVMRAYARKIGEDEDRWGITGLLHDFDWEIHPNTEQHPEEGCKMLEGAGWPPDIVRAIRGHASYLNVPRDTQMAKALFACDELTGFIGAVVAVRPNKSIREVEVRSVRKKLKDKSFAAKVNREEVVQGAQEFGVDLDEHIAFIIATLTENAAALGM
ncbi:MAG TPA: HDIG domain-containing protein [Candidatus Eremiobacteraceae bacterium]|nr:HDIG domain-containing protein [Candidatus Eremiobacteraceae bacterium]